jgi:TonB family protein
VQNRVLGVYSRYYPNDSLYYQFLYPSFFSKKGSVDTMLNEGGYQILECRDSTGKVLLTAGKGYFKKYADALKAVLEEGAVQDGLRTGEWKGVDTLSSLNGVGSEPNVLVKFTEQYENGKLIKGESINKSTGKKATYTSRQVRPEFYGGEAAFGSFLGQTVRYPKIARQANIQGRVYVYFVVNKDGTLGEFKIQKSPDESLSNEVLRVMALSPKWIPGKMYGFPVRVSYTVPVNFALSK